jgi:hypothetical protein
MKDYSNPHPKGRLPFSPTIRPSFGGATGGVSVLLYGMVSLLLGGFAYYQVTKTHTPITDPRILLAIGGAVWFAVRALMLFLAGRKKPEPEAEAE